MKLFSILILSILTLSNCDSKSQSLEELTIHYKAATRGSSVSLIANSSEIQYSDSEDDKKVVLTKENWDEIKELVSMIDVKSIENLTAPSEGSHTDRALIATLSIVIDNDTFESVNFDHGNPPEELKSLIDMLFEFVK